MKYTNKVRKKAMQEARKNSSGETEVTETVQRRQNDPDLTRWQLSGDDLLEELRLKLEGKRIIYEDGRAVDIKRVADEPLLPDEMIDDMLNLCNLYLNKNVQLSEFTEKEIHDIMLYLEKDLIDYFEIKIMQGELTMEQVTIAKNIANFVWAALNRAKYGGEKKFLENTEKRTMSVSRDGNEEKGFLNRLRPG